MPMGNRDVYVEDIVVITTFSLSPAYMQLLTVLKLPSVQSFVFAILTSKVRVQSIYNILITGITNLRN